MKSGLGYAKKLGHWFMDYFYGELALKLAAQGFQPRAVLHAMVVRTPSYLAFREWFPEKDQAAKGTLFWEAGKNIMALFGNQKVASYNLTYSEPFMTRPIPRSNPADISASCSLLRKTSPLIPTIFRI